MNQRTEHLKSCLKERILFLDGAMGTMIQQHNLSEKDFRGERFIDHHTDLKGNNDLLALTQRDVVPVSYTHLTLPTICSV